MESLKSKLREFPYWFYILRGISIYFITLIVKSFVGLRMLDTYSEVETSLEAGVTKIPFFVISIFYFVGTFFLLNSVLNLFCTYDKRVMNEFLDEKWERVYFWRSIKRALRSREFLVECGIVLFFTALGSVVGWYPEVAGMFEATGAPDALLFALPFIIMLPLTFVMSLWRRYEAYRYWHYLARSEKLDKLYRISRLLLRAVSLPILYIFFFPFVPMLGLMFISLSAVFAMLIKSLSLLGFLLAAVVFVALLFIIKALHSLGKRKKLIKQLRSTAAESGYSLSEIKHPYASLFSRKRECIFVLSKDGKTFTCKVIGSFWQRSPLYFVSKSTAYYMHRLGTKNHHVTLLSAFEYDFSGEGDKIIIVNPVPKRIFVSMDEELFGAEQIYYDDSGRLSSVLRQSTKEAKSTRELEPGDKIWGYAIYNTTSFISAIDRKVLGRYNGMFD